MLGFFCPQGDNFLDWADWNGFLLYKLEELACSTKTSWPMKIEGFFVRLYCLFLFVSAGDAAFAQREGDTWLIGRQWPGLIGSGLYELRFSPDDLDVVWRPQTSFSFIGTSSGVCTSDGQSLLWTNGMQILTGSGEVITDTLAFDSTDTHDWDVFGGHLSHGPKGFPKHNAALILPAPAKPNHYFVIYHRGELPFPGSTRIVEWLSAEVALNGDSTWNMITKDVKLTEHTRWFSGSINAVRHANGRDWWLFALGLFNERTYSAFLVDPTGVKLKHKGDLQYTLVDGHEQTVLSPNGDFLARIVNAHYYGIPTVSVYKIDRCAGSLEELVLFEGPHGSLSEFYGVAFSPSSRFLYLNLTRTKLYQADLEATDIASSLVQVGEAERLPGADTLDWGFGPMMQGPDNRIYIHTIVGGQSIHVINRPDLEGPACQLLQHQIRLPLRVPYATPNIPNYRLGPMENSHCDSLGINGTVTSRWRWEPEDPADPLTVRFTDLSFYEPDSWQWDFGGAGTSTIPVPVHTFPDYGMYHVCQTVSNAYHTDSTCQWIELLPVTAETYPASGPFTVSPNPFDRTLRIAYGQPGYTTGEIWLLDLHGRVVYHASSGPIPVTLQVPDLPPGMYVCRVRDADGRESAWKVVRQ